MLAYLRRKSGRKHQELQQIDRKYKKVTELTELKWTLLPLWKNADFQLDNVKKKVRGYVSMMCSSAHQSWIKKK